MGTGCPAGDGAGGPQVNNGRGMTAAGGGGGRSLRRQVHSKASMLCSLQLLLLGPAVLHVRTRGRVI
jgi:hypothetical protein